MAADYVHESPEYVRGTLTDSIAESNDYCHYCGESDQVIRQGCHTHCSSCGGTSEGCGD